MKTFAISFLIFTSFIAGAGTPLSTIPQRVPAPAQFSVRGATSVDIGDTVILTPEEADGCSITWTPIQGIELIEKIVQTKQPRDIIDEELEFIGLPTSSLLFKPNNSGMVRFQCTAINWDKRQFFQVIHSVNVAGNGGNEQDDKETPEPSVKFSKTDYLVLIEESDSRTIETARIVNSEWWQLGLIRDGYNKPLIKDKDGTGQDFVNTAKASGSYSDVPFLAIMDKDGNLITTFKIPNSVDDLKKELGL